MSVRSRYLADTVASFAAHTLRMIEVVADSPTRNPRKGCHVASARAWHVPSLQPAAVSGLRSNFAERMLKSSLVPEHQGAQDVPSLAQPGHATLTRRREPRRLRPGGNEPRATA